MYIKNNSNQYNYMCIPNPWVPYDPYIPKPYIPIIPNDPFPFPYPFKDDYNKGFKDGEFYGKIQENQRIRNRLKKLGFSEQKINHFSNKNNKFQENKKINISDILNNIPV